MISFSVCVRLLVCTILVLFFSSSFVHAQSERNYIFSQIFTSQYDDSARPYFNTSTPVTITTQFRVNLLFAVTSKDETFALDFFVREVWLDPRLTFDPKLWPDSMGALRIPATQKVWKPDTFFLNAISCSTSDSLLTLANNGTLTWSRHMTCTFHTDFDLRQFPFDSQTLSLQRLSYAYTANELLVQQAPNCFLPDPVDNFENSLWTLQSAECSASNFLFRVGQNEYSQIQARLRVKRLFQNYIVKMIMPMFIIVFLSTLTYWIDPSSPPARVGGTVTLVLSIVTFNLVVSQDLPKINYSTLLDWYVWKCFLFTVFAVGEFACVNNILTTKVLPPRLAYLIDDFCCYTITVLWCLSNLLFWPFTDNPGLIAFLAVLEIGYFSINLLRTWWNWRHEKIGIRASGNALYHFIRKHVCKKPPPAEQHIKLQENIQAATAQK